MNTITVKSAATTSEYMSEPTKLLKRIGSTTFVVYVHSSKTSNETMEDKLLRLIESEVRNSA